MRFVLWFVVIFVVFTFSLFAPTIFLSISLLLIQSLQNHGKYNVPQKEPSIQIRPIFNPVNFHFVKFVTCSPGFWVDTFSFD